MDRYTQQVRAFLEAAGIATSVRGETLRHTHGLTLDGQQVAEKPQPELRSEESAHLPFHFRLRFQQPASLGTVEIFVSEADVAEARALLDSAEAGQLRVADA